MDHIFKNCSLALFTFSSYWFYDMRIVEYLKIIAGSSSSFAHLHCVHPGHCSPFGVVTLCGHCWPDLAEDSLHLFIYLLSLGLEFPIAELLLSAIT